MSFAEQLLQKDPASKLLGMELLDIDEESCSVSMPVTENLTNGYGICHGGFVYSLADTASAFASSMEGERILSASSQIEYLLPAVMGDVLTAVARVSCISGRHLFCDVKVFNQKRQVVALINAKLISKNSHS